MGNTHNGAQIYAAERKNLQLEILRRVDDFPATLREIIDEEKEEDTEYFLSIIEENLTNLLYGNEGNGLDRGRDTQEEIETAIRFFPQVLCEKYWGTYPPVYAQLAYFKSVPFIPLLAKLGIELNQFQTEERGGLLYRKWNVLRSLVNNDCRDWYDEEDEDQQRLVDEVYAAVLKDLGDMGILRSEDIHREDLMRELSHLEPFPEHRFRYLVGFDPTCFNENSTERRHRGGHDRQSSIYKNWIQQNDILVFRFVFELGAFHFPTEMAFLFHIDDEDDFTPFELACHEYGTEKVKIILQHFLLFGSRTHIKSDSAGENMSKALVYAAYKREVHLDGVYFLLQRDPGCYCRAASEK